MPFCICKCYFRKNVFIPSINRHLQYDSDDQFTKDYKTLFLQKRIKIEVILQEVKQEIERRRKFVNQTAQRKRTISAMYKPLHPEIFQFNETILHSDFLTLCKFCENDPAAIERYRICDQYFRLYQFPVFSTEFCQKLIDEMENFSKADDLPKTRPNTMNNYGIVLDEIGFQHLVDELRRKYLNPISKLVYPECSGSSGLDSHRAFTVLYSIGGDKKLDLHFDNAESTLNVALNENYEGGELYFTGLKRGESESESKSTTVQHKFGWGVLHRGRQLHSALPLKAGIRQNLILWMRSSSVRNELCPMCSNKPDLIEMENGCYGDGFTL